MSTTAMSLAVRLADEIEQYPLGQCGPSDDPDKQYAYAAGFYDIASRFIAAVKRVGDPDLAELLADVDSATSSYIADAHELRRNLFVVIDAVKERSEDPGYAATAAANGAFLDKDVLLKLRAVESPRLDPRKLIKMCEELNEAYARANYISAVLLLRAIINHVPPIFGAETFASVVAQSGRSVKAILSRLNDESRPIADLHTHNLMKGEEHLPTRNQIEPYKASFEVLIHEILSQLRHQT